MNKLVALVAFVIFLLVLSDTSFCQNKDTASCTITNYRVAPGTFSWRNNATSTTFYDMTSWDSSPYTEGHLDQYTNSSWKFRQNYRLLHPLGYDAAYGSGYPLIVMLHGAGERGNCWGASCYCNECGDPNDFDIIGDTMPDYGVPSLQYLNNDHNLVHGGSTHLSSRNLAGTKKPNDPTLNTRAFPGFVLFPQALNGWGSSTNNSHDINNAMRVIRLLCKQLNIDENRIYVHGLSNGGQATYSALLSADWLFAAAAPMSPISSPTFKSAVDSVATVPMWYFQGGLDANPTPSETKAIVRDFRAAGGNARYTEYPNLGHGTWNTAYNEPDFFSWLLSHDKANIHVYYGNPFICGITGAGAKLGLGQGFLAYQWERDGALIPGAIGNDYVATIPGIYRARFTRESSNPTEQQWNRWSDPVTVTEIMPVKPSIEVAGTTHLRGPNGSNNTVVLKSNQIHDRYTWYKNDVLINIPNNTVDDTVRVYSITTTTTAFNGVYTLRTSGFDNCLSPASDPVTLYFNNSAPLLPDSNLPSSFQGTAISSTSIRLTWLDQSNIERGYEIWRRKSTDTNYAFVKKTSEDVIFYVDTNLESSTTYQYKLRALNNEGRTKFVPGDVTANVNVSVTTLGDNIAPASPQNFTAIASGIKAITFTWQASTDADIKQYQIYHNGSVLMATVLAPSLSYTLTNLPLNTVYNFTVKAIDFSDNVSSPSNQVAANTYLTGLHYKHSTGAWGDLDDVTLVATWASPEFTGIVPSFTIAQPYRTQEDYFNFEFEGYLYITTAGNYTFYINSDDGSKLFLEDFNTPIIDFDGLHGTCGGGTDCPNGWGRPSVSIYLTAGPHPIKAQMFEQAGGEGLSVRYLDPDVIGTNAVVIPSSVLRSGNTPAQLAVPASPTNLIATGFSMTQNNLTWNYVDGLKIVVLGSSTAAGTGASAGNGWVAQLSTWLTSTTPNASVQNLALGGFSTYDVMPNGSTPAPVLDRNITHALTLNPDIIIVNLPTNDVALNIPLETTMSNYNVLKNLATAAGVKMLFTTSQPRDLADQAQRQVLQVTAVRIRADFADDVIDIYDELTNFNVGADYLKIKSTYAKPDGKHVNDAGHSYIFETAKEKLLPYLPDFEIHRSIGDGPFSQIKRVTGLSYSDSPLTPFTIYNYKVRTVSALGNSAFSNVVSAQTLNDTEAPSQPTGLTLTGTTFTNASLIWTASTDNVLVTGYEIYGNNILLGTSDLPGYLASNLNPFTAYTFHVIAYDASGNKSIGSTPVLGNTDTPDTFYSNESGLLNSLTTWTRNVDGSGGSPTDFNSNGQYFIIDRTAPSLGGSWNIGGNISKVIVSDAVTLTVDNVFAAQVEVQGSGVINLDHAAIPNLVSLSSSSTVNYNSNAGLVQKTTYGNLGLTGVGSKTFEVGTTTVTGNVIAGNGVSLKGSINNTSTLLLSGNLTFNGIPATLAPAFGVVLEMNKNGTQTITSGGNLDIHQLKTAATSTIAVVNSAAPFTLITGSATGGGLSLTTGSTLNLGVNNLLVRQAGTINSSSETGRLKINEGDVDITSISALNSNLYFDPADHTVKYFAINLTGSGDVLIRSTLKISEALKIKSGEYNAGGHVTLLSTAAKTANIQEIENNGSITGNVTVQRLLQAKGRVYRYISSPVAGVTVADWQLYFPITGNFIGASTGAGLSTLPSLYYYNEPTGWINYPTLATDDTSKPIEKGKGYAAFIRNADTPTLLQVTGQPYQGNVNFLLVGATSSTTGWNLLGNPYASTIRWSNVADEWIKSGTPVSSTVAVRDNPLGQFKYYDYATALGGDSLLIGGKIAPGQAFWVQSITNTPSQITITEKAKSTEQQTHYREASPVAHIQIDLAQNTKSDPAYIAFTDYGTDQYDKEFDGSKRENVGMFNLSTLINDTISVVINNVSDGFCSKTVKLNVQNVSEGSYQLNFKKIESLVGVGKITLSDKFTEKEIDLTTATTYSFVVGTDTQSFGKDRFSITFGRPDVESGVTMQTVNACGEDGQVTLTKSQKGVEYTIINNANELISEVVRGTGSQLLITIPQDKLLSGENNLRLKTGFKGCTPIILPIAKSLVYTPKPNVIVSEESIVVCQGVSANLNASGAPEGGTYKWFDERQQEILGMNTANFITSPILKETLYFVSAVSGTGCTGSQKMISISPEVIEAPEVTFENDTLYTNKFGRVQWYKDGEVIENANSFKLKPEGSGSYTVSSFSARCSVESTPIDVVITGTESSNGNFRLSVFPNPAPSHEIHIKVINAQQLSVEITVMDMLGKPLLSKFFSAADLKDGIKFMPDKTLAQGLYLIIAKQGKSVAKRKLVVKN